MPRKMTLMQLLDLAEELTPLLEEMGWGPDQRLVSGPWGLRFLYPAGAERWYEQQASLWVHANRKVVSCDDRGRRNHPDPTEIDPPVGRGWRKRLIETVLAEARRLGRLDDDDLPFKLEDLPVQEFSRMEDSDLRKFVLGVADGQIFTSAHMDGGYDHSLMGMVFMPIAFGAMKPAEEFLALLPEPPEEPGDKPETPTLDLPDKPENTVKEPAYPEEPKPPEPKDVPRHIIEAVEWGEIDESEIDDYREGRGAFLERLAKWQVEKWQPWKDTVDDLRGKHEADIAAYEAQVAAWEAECATLQSGYDAEMAGLQEALDAWAEADRKYRAEKAHYDRIIGRAYQHHFQHLGLFWEWMSAAGPRSVNGYPIFFSCRIMHTEDWERARRAIIREQERRESIEL